MTTPPAKPAPLDPSNPFVLAGKYPAQPVISQIPTTTGTYAGVTIRSAGATLTVLLTREEIAEWAALFQQASDNMSGLTVVRTPSAVRAAKDLG